jgi:hypothetical protein
MASYIGTIIPLPAEQRRDGWTHILRLTYAEIAQLTSGTLQAVLPANTLGSATQTLPAGTMIRRAVARVVTAVAASAGTLTTLTFILGDDGSTNRYVASMDAMTAAWGTVVYHGIYNYAAANTVDIIFTLNTNSTAVISTVATLSAGQIDIYLEIVDASKLSTVAEPSAT